MICDMNSVLRASSLFQGCSVDQSAFAIFKYPSGQIIHDQPKGISSVGVVASGRVDVYSVAADGRDVWLNSLHTGECFGIYNLVADGDLETVLCCAEDTVIYYIAKTTLLKWMETDQKLALQYAKLCNEKLQFLIRRIEQLTTQTCRRKIAVYLLAQKTPDGQVRPSCSREELARRLGVSRAALVRELAALQSLGLISTQNDRFLITDPEGLEQMIYQSAK